MSQFTIKPSTPRKYNGGLPRKSKHGEARRGQHSLEWDRWIAMLTRCENPKASNFKRYGGRGIKVCERWKSSFEDFLNDMGRIPSQDHTIDRQNNDGDYEPDNCKWSTRSEQQNNRRNTILIEHDGKKLSSVQWSRITGVPAARILHRIKHGWLPEEAVSTPATKKNQKHHGL